MASESRIREAVAELLGRPHNVRFEEIEWVMNQLEATGRPCKHGYLFRIQGRRILVNKHNNGKDTVPRYSVEEFRDLMTELGLCD
jgi:hypothetical protein